MEMKLDKSMFKIKEILTDSSICVYISTNKSLAVSECSVIDTVLPNGSFGSCLYFNRIFVPIELRGNGIGSLLLKRMLTLVSELEMPLCCDINSYGDLDNSQLFDWYCNNGFKPYLVKYNNFEYNQLWFNLSKGD